ncbi:D-alanyl-D-alanine carboxypeptidase [uncultured Maricaulis sp.]|uniref:D-alanyl-D-alanine carboxypeptidase n=1 Tax=uncultured Maricaulis sp. TaxID=174710 RepID=UPI0030DBB0DD|tara:strand:- start:25639 stop:26931 length:1293 start_codon:yes stop_codon:yes gene_type:complete
MITRPLHFAAVLLLVLSWLAPLSPARADTSRYAAFVVDQNTGVVLHSRQSEATRYPASLTKMMTLYLLFNAIETGELELNDQIRVSAHAANAAPSRLDLPIGSTISVEDAIRALVIRSANDVAVAVGERLGGTETAFATIMTTKARELGMPGTTFRNASGLPDSRQTTTARDMARLAIALQRDFPSFFHYFDETRFVWDGRTYRNHNTLVGRVDGVDGLKTGYIRASGFNVVVSATRGEHRLVAVIMGGPTAASRDAHAEELLDAAFSSLEQRDDRRLFAALSSPRINPIRQQELIAQDVAALNLDSPIEMGSAQAAPPLRIILADESSELTAQPAAEPTNPTGTTLLRGAWSVQVGAYNSAAAARDRLDRVTPASSILRLAQPAARSVDINGNRLWRARFESLTADEAANACAELGARNEPCYTVAPGR